MKFYIKNKLIGDNNSFIIAEIGQNHQGDIDIAKQLIKSAKECGVDAVKFQKSCLSEKFTKSALIKPYKSENSWGSTYGEHKKYLEFSYQQYILLQEYSNEIDILFSASAMDIESLKELYKLNVPFIKIGSGDCNNFPLVEYAAQQQTPIIISSGMQSEFTIRKIIEIFHKYQKKNFCLMHCVSSYPTHPMDCNLQTISTYRQWFPNICIGYSGHEQGIGISCAAITLGANIIERHMTLNKRQKGTDHKLSLEPFEFKALVNTIRSIENDLKTISTSNAYNIQSILIFMKKYFNSSEEMNAIELSLMNKISSKKILACEIDCRLKLGKTIVYSKDLKSGVKITTDDISIKVTDCEQKRFSTDNYFDIINKILKVSVKYEDSVCFTHFQ